MVNRTALVFRRPRRHRRRVLAASEPSIVMSGTWEYNGTQPPHPKLERREQPDSIPGVRVSRPPQVTAYTQLRLATPGMPPLSVFLST
jgi:hypothetical protein